MNKPFHEQRAAAENSLRLRCLGRFQLEDSDGAELTPRTRKARALLAFLALSARPASRDRLADLLWSDRGEEQAKSSLRQAIFELRHLGDKQASLVSLGRDEIALNTRLLATDLSRIRDAAEADDIEQLEALLAESDSGLLADLDGLDAEFDAWLQVERAHEPARTLTAALSAAERCLRDRGPAAAQPIVSQVQRLDPCSEEAARLALRIDHQIGDSGALHRHYELLTRRLREDYDAAPSRETQDLFKELTGGAAPLTAPDDRQADAPTRVEPVDAPPRRLRRKAILATLAALAAILLLVLGWWALRPAAGSAEQPPLIAVLPFEQHPAGDGFLAEGLWEDTRSALSQNRSLRVLGKAPTRAMVEERSSPAVYRKRLGVAYLLEGSVRRGGDRVRVSVSLTRTADGVAIWNQSFAGRLGDALALQEAVAQGIEGRLRGRLATGGGKRPEQIVTSPEVYALYSEARTLLRERESNGAKRAERLLREAVALDPNFAPAWSSLGAALYFSDWGPIHDADKHAESVASVRRALALAPRLAQAHATLALIAGDTSAESERALERAVDLDPGYAEAWLWLGNLRNDQYRWGDAAAAYRRAVDIDPLWFPAVHNLATTLTELGDNVGADRLLQSISQAGADRELIVTTRAEKLLNRGDYSAAIQELIQLRRDSPGTPLNSVQMGICEGLLRLGYADEAARVCGYPAWFGPVVRSQRQPPEIVAGKPMTADEFWRTQYFPTYASRAMVNLGRGDKLVEKYRGAFHNADDFISAFGSDEELTLLAPSLSVALRGAGSGAEADYLLSTAAKRLERAQVDAPDNRELLWSLGMIRAAQGRHEDALRLIARAIERGWLPDPRFNALDLAQEPALRGLHGNPRFERARRRILAHIARERAELGAVKL